MTIQQLSQEVGIGIDTLRIWERRYGFPQPGRDARGHRSYSPEQVEQLRTVKNLLNLGQRPGKVLTLSTGQRQELLHRLSGGDMLADDQLQRLVKELTPQEITLEINRQRQKLGLKGFIRDFVLPLLQLLDHGWTTGSISIAREHLISDQLENLLKKDLSGPALDARPRILFLTVSGERHKLGLLLAAACFQAERIHCLWLNEDLPLTEIPGLAQELGVDGVALSFSVHYSKRQAKEDLAQLRMALEQDIVLVAGGHAVQQIRGLPNLLICTDLEQIGKLVRRHFASRKTPT